MDTQNAGQILSNGQESYSYGHPTAKRRLEQQSIVDCTHAINKEIQARVETSPAVNEYAIFRHA
jgi:hypothetical protein